MQQATADPYLCRRLSNTVLAHLCFTDYAEAFDCVGHNQLWEIVKKMGIPDHLLTWETCMQVKKQQLELDMDQQTGSK